MKKKITKQINIKVKELLIEWLRNLLDEHEQKKITDENYKDFLPKNEYIIANKTYYLPFYTPRWAKQNMKKLYKKGVPIKDVTIRDLEWNLTKKNQSRF